MKKRLAGMVLALSVATATSPCFAQEMSPVRSVRPEPVPLPRAVNGQGHAQTWDGMVFIITQREDPDVQLRGWFAFAFRPGVVEADASGVPVFGESSFSDRVLIEADVDQNPPPGGQPTRNHLALVPDPAVDGLNPFPCELDPNLEPLPRDDGELLCYEVLVFCLYDTTPNATGGEHGLGMRRMRLVVANPGTEASEVVAGASRMLSNFQPLRDDTGSFLLGVEPTATVDARLVVWQGEPSNNGGISFLMYSFNPTPGISGGWSAPKSINRLYWDERDRDVGGIRFSDLYPIAQRPLCSADGSIYLRGDSYPGAYPWITLDGSEIVHTSTRTGRELNELGNLRAGLSVVGRFTGWTRRHIDGPLNPSRYAEVPDEGRHTFSAPGIDPGMWKPWRKVAGRRLPYTGQRPLMPLFGTVHAEYGEVDFADLVDRDYVLAFNMNELLGKDQFDPRAPVRKTACGVDIDAVADTSGHFNTGELQGGAEFPVEYLSRWSYWQGQGRSADTNPGVLGRCVFFPASGVVRVPHSRSLALPADELTVECSVLRLASGSDTREEALVLVRKAGAYRLVLRGDGRIEATVFVGGQRRRTGPLGPALPVFDTTGEAEDELSKWTHVAFTWDAERGVLSTWIAGRLVAEQYLGEGAIDVSSADLEIGPAGYTAGPAPVRPGEAVVALDEVRISRVVRRADEMARRAFVEIEVPEFFVPPAGLRLPLGLRADALRIPADNAPTTDTIALGSELFFDPGLSGDGTISCATCHDPDQGYADRLAIAKGIGGAVGTRNSPTIINRAFSTRQFWDGRAGTLEEQVLEPIENELEMGSSVTDVLVYLSSKPGYSEAFQRTYGEPPSADTLSRALASFVRSLVAGDSPVDAFEARTNLAALNDGEKRGRALFLGKARCVACHNGVGYSDEGFHRSVIDSTDAGRFDDTGRARDRGAFKTPTLRGLPETAPYFHNGSVETLENVVKIYNEGGRAALADPEIRPLELSQEEMDDLVAFLRALNGPLPR